MFFGPSAADYLLYPLGEETAKSYSRSGARSTRSASPVKDDNVLGQTRKSKQNRYSRKDDIISWF